MNDQTNDMIRPESRPRGRTVAWLAAAGAFLLLVGCGTSGTVEKWRMTEVREPGRALADSAPASAVRVVFYRQQQATVRSGQPVNLYINGQYQASLVGNTYTEQLLCPGTHRLAVHFNDVRQRYVTKAEGRAAVVGAQTTQYFEVNENAAGEAIVRPADAGQAAAAGSLRELQTHTISRVVADGCNRG